MSSPHPYRPPVPPHFISFSPHVPAASLQHLVLSWGPFSSAHTRAKRAELPRFPAHASGRVGWLHPVMPTLFSTQTLHILGVKVSPIVPLAFWCACGQLGTYKYRCIQPPASTFLLVGCLSCLSYCSQTPIVFVPSFSSHPYRSTRDKKRIHNILQFSHTSTQRR